MTGRRLLLGLLLGCLATAAAAQNARLDTAPLSGTVQATPEPRPAPRRVQLPAKPQPLDLAKRPAQPQPPRVPDLRIGTLAPMPNRNLEGPRVVIEDRASLGPSVINRNLPGRGQAVDGSPSLLEDKLFRPAPGARLSVPFSY